ncbi:multidrug transporter [Bifidobacterium animalis subsp. animalis]|nr:multidrug transporter [Bifidobacterium animalis subsp. animalis]
MAAIANTTMITAKDGQQHSWKSIKLLIATLIVSTLGDGFCGVMMVVALPNISDTYHISIATANWVTVGYSIVCATAVMTAAAVLARMGLKRMFFWSRILLIASSLIGLFSLNFPMMLGSRLIQAVGSGLMYPTINTVIIRIVPPKISGRVVSLNSAIIGLGIAVAPLLSGMFLTYVSLTSMYVVPLVIGIISLIMGAKFVFDVESRKKQPIDMLSVALAFVGLALVMLGFSELTHRPGFAIPMLVGGIAVLVWFGVRQFHLAVPLLDLKPMRHLFVSVGVLLYMAGSMGQQAVLLLLPLYMERACDRTPFISGCFLLIMTLFYSGSILFAGKRVDAQGMWPIVSIGFAFIVVGLFATFVAAPTRIVWLVVLIGCLVVIGDAFINVPDKDVVFEALPDNLMPDTSAIFSTGAQIASSLGSALFVGVLSADVLRQTAHGMNRHLAYANGFQHSILIAAAFEVVMLIISLWYSREMVRHGRAKIAVPQS